MKFVFAPMQRLLSGRNKQKQLFSGALFTVPLAISVWSHPPGWDAAGIGVGVTFLLALYYLAGLLATTDNAWKDIHFVADLLDSNDLRRQAVLDARTQSAASRQGRGQMGKLYKSLVRIHENLGQVVGQTHRSAEAARTAAEHLARGNVELSERSEEQASTLEETAAAMEQLSATVRQNAESCREASQLAAGATGIAREGSDVAQKAVATMDRIDRSSKKVVEIVSVIEGISFQTNILALNAAVEAARAGEQGRGFAVVASEVRSLAQRSAQAAKEIKGLIEESVGSVEQGARLVHDAGRVIAQVSSSVEQVNELIGVIAVASREQASGVESVNKAITQLQAVTQKTSAVVQDAAFASVGLKEEAARLFELVGRFRTDEAGKAVRPVADAQVESRKVIAKLLEGGGGPAAKVVRPKGGKPTAEPASRPDEWQEF